MGGRPHQPVVAQGHRKDRADGAAGDTATNELSTKRPAPPRRNCRRTGSGRTPLRDLLDAGVKVPDHRQRAGLNVFAHLAIDRPPRPRHE